MRITFIGGGAMGEAIVSAALKSGAAQAGDIVVSEPVAARRDQLAQAYGVGVSADNAKAVEGSSLVLLAVKPQEFGSVAEGLRGHLGAGQTVLSIMAGVPIARISRELGHEAVVRAMPNTAAFVGEAMSVWTASAAVSNDGRAAARAVLAAMGRELQVDDEKFLDMATAANGSGPGFIFFLLEAFIDAAEEIGFAPDAAAELMTQTLFGSAKLARESGKPARELRQMVTSKGGTTAAGMQVLESAEVRRAIRDAVRAAYERAKELGS